MQSGFRAYVCVGGCVAAVALACGGSSVPVDPCAPPDGGAPALELGTGELEFEPVPEDRQVPLGAGSQGGYHVWLSMRARGLCPGRHEVRLTVAPEAVPESKSVSNVRMSFEAVEGRPGWVEHVGWPARVFNPECTVDEPVHLTVHMEVEDESVQADVEVIPTAPETGFSQACEQAP